jgi:SAM-dependent methyltransferase
MKAIAYDVMYRFHAPWEIGPRPELVQLVESGRLTPDDPGSRAIDLGCGSGANSSFLSAHGFEVTGVDFSRVALAKARRTHPAGVPMPRYVEGNLTAERIEGAEGPFDLLVDYGTLDDLSGEARRAMARTIVRVSHSGSKFLLWCFYGEKAVLPRFSFTAPSRIAAGLAHGEELELFAHAFEVEVLGRPEPGRHGFGCFLMTRR